MTIPRPVLAVVAAVAVLVAWLPRRIVHEGSRFHHFVRRTSDTTAQTPVRLTMLLLVGLIIRGVSFEYRSKHPDSRYRKMLDTFATVGSFVVTLVLGVVPKSYLPTYREFYERRQMAPGDDVRGVIRIGDERSREEHRPATDVPFGPNAGSTIEYPSADQPNVAMYPLSENGPYYAFIMTQAAVDTNGGPVINPNAQIVRWDGSAIEGLYGAGNCIANPSVDAYWGGGATLGNAHVWGFTAAKHATESPEKSVS